ncbi:TrlF family AAA-like ATPase [Cupriavidus sp. PET2-C1]
MVRETIAESSSGAAFFRGDLHIHSYGGSYDVSDAGATPEAIIGVAQAERLSLIAIADHNEIANVRLAVAAGKACGAMVVPAVELSTPEGHLLCYVATPDALERFFNRLQIADRGTPNCRCQTGALQCLELIAVEGGFGIMAHVDLGGAFESNMPRLTPAKLDILCHRALLGIEVTRADCPITYTAEDSDADRRHAVADRISRLRLGSRQFLARILNSDAHSLSAIGRNASQNRRITRYKMESPSFEGLKLALQSADTRIRIEDEVPMRVPMVRGVHFQGGFLDGEAINFSPNLTCIIGGRGSGKSTAFESICLLGGCPTDEVSVIDSDVWPDLLSLVYIDQAGQEHSLARSRQSNLENLDNVFSGPCIFPMENYRQGATNEISRKVQSDPLALLTFLDTLVQLEESVQEEDAIREKLIEIQPAIAKALTNVARIPNAEKDLKLKSGQLEKLRTDKGEEVIALQQQLESERRTRGTLEQSIGSLESAVSCEALIEITEGIKLLVSPSGIKLAADEATAILNGTHAFEVEVRASNQTLSKAAERYVATVQSQIDSWKKKEETSIGQIEQKKAELLKHGIRLDMPFIQKLVSDEARAKQTLANLKTWIAERDRRRGEYNDLLQRRWAARAEVSKKRTAFAAKANAALRGTLSDLFVSLKFDANGLAPEAERIVIDAMGWRTLQQLKAGALIRGLTMPRLLECIRAKDIDRIVELKNEDDAPIFGKSEAEQLLERLSEAETLFNLETVAVHDRPRLNVTKRFDAADGRPKFVPRDFKRLSLGQQQSVLLALMLTSESNAPLVVDQPEDNLDSEFIYKTLVPVIRAAKERRQVIVVTHNANIAVLGDAELIVALKATNDRAKVVTRGSIDHPQTCEAACSILEGSREAFDRRAAIYGDGARVRV